MSVDWAYVPRISNDDVVEWRIALAKARQANSNDHSRQLFEA